MYSPTTVSPAKKDHAFIIFDKKTKRQKTPLNDVVSTGRRPFTLAVYRKPTNIRATFSPPVAQSSSFPHRSLGFLQQNTFFSCEETRGYASISDLKDPVVCPKPRRLAILANNHIKHPLKWHQAEACDSKAGADLLDIILNKASSHSPDST
ncbi:hypothetical protein SDJN02_00351, partial [Cucurbita argyrosperma subsp. argyrosperma]